MRIIGILLAIAGVILLQVFLSKKENKWLGCILPALSFLYSVVSMFMLMAPEDGATWAFLVAMLITFMTSNLPTLVLLAIYFGFHGKRRRRVRRQ